MSADFPSKKDLGQTDQVHKEPATGNDVGLSAELLNALRPNADNELSKVRQLYLSLYQSIETGQLGYNTRLPASRALASQLGLGRNTVISVYEQLISEGLLSAHGKRGTRVIRQVTPQMLSCNSPVQLSERSKQWRPKSNTFVQLAPGEPDPQLFPQDAFRKAQTKAVTHSLKYLGYQTSSLDEARKAIARYLVNYRSLTVDPSRIIVTASTRQSLALAASLFADPGDSAWLECPGYQGAVEAFQQLGLVTKALKLDEHGLILPKTIETLPRIIYSTPCFQYPYGMPLSAERRQALIDFSRQHGTVLFEDDYDSEFRNDSQPRPSLAVDADGAQVLNAGTFSKLMFPAIRVAWLVVPESAVDKANHALRVLGGGSNSIAQLSITELLNDGTLSKHLRRAKHLYEQRRTAFLQALGSSDWLRPIDYASSNLSLVLQLNQSVSIIQLESALQQQKIGAVPLERLNWEMKKPTKCKALVVGLGNVDTLTIPAVVKRLNKAVHTAVKNT